MKLIKEKGATETSSPMVEHISLRNISYDSSYLSGFTTPSHMSSTSITDKNTHPYVPPTIRQNLGTTLFVSSSGAGPADPMIVSNLDDSKEWEKLKQIKSSNK